MSFRLTDSPCMTVELCTILQHWRLHRSLHHPRAGLELGMYVVTCEPEPFDVHRAYRA